MHKFLLLTLLSSSFAYADTCKGIWDCAKLYEKLTNKKVETKFVPKNITILDEEISFTKEDVENKFVKYINETGISITAMPNSGLKLLPMRRGAGIIAPTFRANENILNKIKEQKERVNLVYTAKVFPKNLVDASVKKLLSNGKEKGVNIVEFADSKTIFISDLGTNAYKIIKRIEEQDK